MNPNKEQDRGRLSKAMEQSYRHLEPFRNLVALLVEEYAGSGYGPPKARTRRDMINLMNQMVDAYTMSLAANRPRVLVSTAIEGQAYFAKLYQVGLNNLIKEIELEQTLRQVVLNACFCVGITKVHRADSVAVQLEEGLWADPGSPFASSIPLDNFVFDMSATRWDRIQFAGDSYRIPFDELKDDIFDQKIARKLQPTSKHTYEDGSDQLRNISTGQAVDRDECEPMIDLVDVWVPREKRIYTFPLEPHFALAHPPLADMEPVDTDSGDYELLGFNDVPENIMPTSPASHTAMLSRLVNNLMRKQARRAKAQCNVHTYTPAGAEDAKKIQRASDDQWIEVANPGEIGSVEMGGISSEGHAFMLGVVEMFDRMAGNLSAMMGLGPQADTVGQEKLIYGAVSKKEAQMQYRTVDHATRVVRKLGRLLWEDQAKTLPGQMPIEGAEDILVDATWSPDNRQGEPADYDLVIDVFSMPYQSPAQRVAALNQLVTGVFVPLGDQLTMQGGTIDMQRLTEIYADLLNLPRLKEIVKFIGAPTPQPQAEGASGPANTTRTYERRSVPTSGSVQARQRVAQSEWLDSGQNNPDQKAMLTRPAG